MNFEDQKNITDKIFYLKSVKARNIRISIKSSEKVLVTVPLNKSYAEAENFVNQKIKWIQKHLTGFEKLMENFTLFDNHIDFKTRNHQLIFCPQETQEKIKIKIVPGIIKFSYPITINLIDKKVQSFIRKGVEEAWRIEAKEYLPQRLLALSKQFGFIFNQISVRNSTSRWGSCSGKNNINLSLHLMRLPDHLIDYVILHELTHTVHKNHGNRFWNLLNKVCPNTNICEKEMKNFRTLIY